MAKAKEPAGKESDRTKKTPAARPRREPTTARKEPAKQAKALDVKPRREPTPAAVLKKVAAVTDTTKSLQKEIKAMSKIFADNQKVLLSMKGMMDALASTLESMQQQSRRISVLEDDAQKIHSGLERVRSQSALVDKINSQTARLQEEVDKMGRLQDAAKTEQISKQVEDSMNAIKNNSHMIIKIAQRIDEVRDGLRAVAAKTDSASKIAKEVENLRSNIDQIAGKTNRIKINADAMEGLKRQLEEISRRAESASGASAELDSIRSSIGAISDKASKIDSMGAILEGLKRQFDAAASKAAEADAGVKKLAGLADKIAKMEAKVVALAGSAGSGASVKEDIGSVREDLAEFKRSVSEKTGGIEQKISFVSDMLKRQDESASEFHKKSDKMMAEIRSMRGTTDKTAHDSSSEMMAVLKLAEYQSTVRMLAETKYGTAKDLESMAAQTADMVNLFERVSIEAGDKIPLPLEVRQWAVSKMLDCADKWEVRFGDVYSIMTGALGKEMLKEAVRVQQVRDIYGIRAVDEMRSDLGIS